jgi:Flp pilus assembly protein TadB
MTFGLLLGSLFGAALCLLLLTLVPPRRGIGSAVARWERQRSRRPVASTAVADDRIRTVGRRLDAALASRGITLEKLRGDLELTGRSMETHLVKKSGYAIFGFLLPSMTAALIRIADAGNWGVTIPAVVGIPLAAAFFMLPDYTVAAEAEMRRTELRRALSCYLDLVAMSLAGGRGLPETVPSCARIGTGWAFDTIQDTINHARYVGETPWQALEQLGERTRIQELQDLGGALTLVADDGSKVRATLTARAATQRRRQLAEAEGTAAKADQSIQIAQVVLAAGFFLFLGYPALVAVMNV